MKTLRITLLLCIGSALVLSSCDKDDDTAATTAERLQHYWSVDSVSVKTTTTLGSATILYKGTANDYYDFKTNGNLHYKLNTEEDILPYSILSNTWLLVDGDSAQIISLSNNRLHVYQKDVKNSTDYVETTAWFRR